MGVKTGWSDCFVSVCVCVRVTRLTSVLLSMGDLICVVVCVPLWSEAYRW